MTMKKVRFAIDRGGTFTDVYAELPDGTSRVLKLLSVDPAYTDAPREGIRRVLEEVTGRPHPRDAPVDTTHIESIRMGTTVATNALLERKGERCALLITRGFRDLLHIGNQARPRIFDLEIAVPDLIYERVVEIDERVELVPQQQQQQPAAKRTKDDVIQGITGEFVRVVQPPDHDTVTAQLTELHTAGFDNVAIVFLHAYTFPDHERLVGKLALSMGFSHVTLSSEVMPMVKIVPRGYTSCADAYLTPAIKRYIDGFCSGFDAGLKNVPVLFMQSDGGLAPIDRFSGFRAILSGPAGGVVGYSQTSFGAHTSNAPVIGFDMGGTSTDVSRFAGTFEHVFETTTAGITIQAPQLDINTVAAGGGSCLFFRSGMFVVGPESASAHPGPVCYRKGGPLAVTDANLQLGRLLPEYFPQIFGPAEDQPLDTEATSQAFLQLQEQINSFCAINNQTTMDVDEIAYGFVNVANEAMCRPIRALTQAKGYDTKQHVLACFGGAGSQHACAIARKLGMRKIFIHRFSSILSAYGIARADVVRERQEPCALAWGDAVVPQIRERLDRLRRQAEDDLKQYGFSLDMITTQDYVNLRYEGTDFAIMTAEPADGSGFLEAFLKQYKREFGFILPDRKIFIDDVRVRAVGSTSDERHLAGPVQASKTQRPVKQTPCYFEGGRVATDVYLVQDLVPLEPVVGPAMIIDNYTTIVVEPGCVAHVSEGGDVVIDVNSTTMAAAISTDMDPIQLAIFSHRFMSIAEQMGRTLQRTSISTNIKERLDFSCALFSPEGGLVANAPHIPVHLGAMQEAIRYQLGVVDVLEEGDVLVSNHPQAGGSHLPDITVMTPVFDMGKVVFFVASRGHHADIGGIAPGSMPPMSKELYQEGACIKSFKLVKRGEFQHDGIVELLNAPGKYPGCSPTRNVRDVLADLKAQIAANHKGICLVQELIGEYSLEVVQAYMRHIQANAEMAVRDMLKSVATCVGTHTLEAIEYMDDGTPICLRVTINATDGSAIFDFTGTGMEVLGNCNAPPAVTYSAIIYCLRCMVKADVPLNQGCLTPITIHIPAGSILCPSETAAVVGGNVETSQRVTDVILKAFGVCASSQGTMNNLTFGDDTFGYYETIAGGAGAGPTWHGRSGVHTHMTNTRITDPEILERRYPVILRQFSLRPHSGGLGQHRGGDGIIRELEFRRPLSVSVLSERRVHRPNGLLGGQAGEAGMNILTSHRGRRINLGGKNIVQVQPGDVLTILTPGGGGYGDVRFQLIQQAPERAMPQQQQQRDFGSVAEYRRLQESV